MVKNITLSAEEKLIHKAREKALKEKKTLNEIFRDWLARYTGQSAAPNDYIALMKKLHYSDAGKHFNREELNER